MSSTSDKTQIAKRDRASLQEEAEWDGVKRQRNSGTADHKSSDDKRSAAEIAAARALEITRSLQQKVCWVDARLLSRRDNVL
jgi:hypothetical protein